MQLKMLRYFDGFMLTVIFKKWKYHVTFISCFMQIFGFTFKNSNRNDFIFVFVYIYNIKSYTSNRREQNTLHFIYASKMLLK